MQLKSGIPKSYLDTDGTLTANSDAKVPSQKAVKTYVGTASGGIPSLLPFVIGDILCASSTSALAKLPGVATGQVLVSGGVGVPPAYSATPSLTTLMLGLVGTPATALEVTDTVSTSPRGIMSSQYNIGTDGARLHLRKGRGTRAVPTTVVTADNLGRIVGSGYVGPNNTYLEMASIIFGTEGTISDGAGAGRLPTNISLWTATDAAPSVITQAVWINSAQAVGIGTAPSHRLHVLDANTTASRAGLYISQTAAITGTGYGANINKTGASTTNVALYVAASGATNNYGIQVANGAALVGSTAWPTSVIGLGAGRLCVASVSSNAYIIFHDDTVVAADTGPGGLVFTGRTNDTGPAYSQLANISGKKENATQGNTAAYLKVLVNNGTTSNSEKFRFDSGGNFGNVTAWGASAAKVFGMASGTAPTAFLVDMAHMCVKDQAAGNATFHFYTELGQIIKLYQQAHLDDPDAAGLVAWAANINLYLENLGFNATV